MSGKSALGILLEDVTGVGSEIIIKLAASRFYDEYCCPVVIGDVRVSKKGARIRGLEIPVQVVNKVGEVDRTKGMPVSDQGDMNPEQVPFTDISIESGHACLNILKITIEPCQTDRINGFCFTPLNKQAMIQAGCSSGNGYHYMAHLFGHTDPFGEINVLGDLWIIKTTSHTPISKVSRSLTMDTITRAIGPVSVSLKDSGIKKPRLALAALNPYCGEGGKCGREEVDVIAPVIEKAREMGISVDRPLPSDVLFIEAFNGDFDGVVTVYHDQGQTALRLKGPDRGITIARGLPAPVVTCAHSTAYDIAGRGVIKTSTFENVAKMATKMATHLKSC